MARQVARRLNPLAAVETDTSKIADADGKALVARSAEIAIAASLTQPTHFTPGDLPAVVAEVPAIAAPGVEQPAPEVPVSPAPLVEPPPAVPMAITETVADATPRLLESSTRATQPFAFNQPFASTMESAMTTAEDFMAFGQGNFEAMMKSGQIWAAGVQDLGKHVAASAQAQLDQTMTTWKAMAGLKSVKEAMDMQTGMARAAVEAAVSETGKLTDASMKLSEQTIAPITARLSLAAEKFGRVPA